MLELTLDHRAWNYHVRLSLSASKGSGPDRTEADFEKQWGPPRGGEGGGGPGDTVDLLTIVVSS